MKKTIQFAGQLSIYDAIEELVDEREQALCYKAISAQDRAYAPYSRFTVGASVLMSGGQIVMGSNQENAVYPLGLCAERVAIFAAHNIHPDSRIRSIALTTSADLEDGEAPVFPCGSCRQVLVEEEYRTGEEIRILVLDTQRRVYVVEGINNILPFAMNKDSLD